MHVRPQPWRALPVAAEVFVALIVIGGTAVLVQGALHPVSRNVPQVFCYLLVAMLGSRLKSTLPSGSAAMTFDFLFILLGISELSFAETLALGSFAVLLFIQFRDRPPAIHITFKVCASALAIAAAFSMYRQAQVRFLLDSRALLLMIAAATYFVVNTGCNAVATALGERRSMRAVWAEYFWAFPYYLLGAAVALGISWCNRLFQWETSLLLLPVVYLIYRSYRLYLGKLEGEKRHVEEVASLHMRTIEALALAIEAKDHTTHEHLQRVRVYALEVGKELKISPSDLEALQAAALLHDIGKLAIPEHIISKPGRLTPEEFDKMKIHPVVGAEILERVRFPYPVVPIVRAHHEKWDGSGYPYGLKGTEIPIGARILSAVDFLDAMASDRQYRRALPLEEVMKRLQSESGKSYDPEVVAVLQRRYRDLEKLVESKSGGVVKAKLSTEVKVDRGLAPAAGFEKAPTQNSPGQEAKFLHSIAAARQEAQTLFELSQDLGASLSLDETLSVFSAKLRRLVPYDAIAIYVRREDELVPEHVSGENFRLFSSLRIPLGQGLSGWVAQNRKPILNGNPSVEPGYLNDPSKYSSLRSALAIPMEGLAGVVGVLTLYRDERDAFTSDHLRMLLAISSKMALAVENALKYQQAESSATTDFLTGLPNARSLFLELDREMARCKRDNTTLTVMVCDMDGFKMINDRFGHLEGNRVLRLFAQALRDSCREYDYVARMGGDEFVVITPGLPADSAKKKVDQLRDLAILAGREVCGEDLLSLSVGRAQFPEDGTDAEKLLSEADRRMYLEKQRQPNRKNRRLYPRMKGRVTIELQAGKDEVPVLANLTDISLGGCFVETSALMTPGTAVKLVFSIDDGKMPAEGIVVRMDPGTGVAIQFNDMNRAGREGLHRILEFVQKSSAHYDNHYFRNLLSR